MTFLTQGEVFDPPKPPPGEILLMVHDAIKEACNIINKAFGFTDDDKFENDKVELGAYLHFKSADPYDDSLEFYFFEENYKKINHENFPEITGEQNKQLLKDLGCTRVWICFFKNDETTEPRGVELYLCGDCRSMTDKSIGAKEYYLKIYE